MTMSKFSEVFIIVRRDRIWSFCMLFRAHFIFWDAMSCWFTLVSEGGGDTPRTWTMEWPDFSCQRSSALRTWMNLAKAEFSRLGHCGFREGARDMAMVTWRFFRRVSMAPAAGAGPAGGSHGSSRAGEIESLHRRGAWRSQITVIHSMALSMASGELWHLKSHDLGERCWSSRTSRLFYQIYKRPSPLEEAVIEDVKRTCWILLTNLMCEVMIGSLQRPAYGFHQRESKKWPTDDAQRPFLPLHSAFGCQATRVIQSANPCQHCWWANWSLLTLRLAFKDQLKITLLGVIPSLTCCFDIFFGILSDIYSDNISGILSFWHSIWHFFWHSIWHRFWHSICPHLASGE